MTLGVPTSSAASGLPPEPLGIAGPALSLRPLTPSECANLLPSKTDSFISSVQVVESSRERWYHLPFVCVMCNSATLDWVICQMNDARDCVCRSCFPSWRGSFLRSTFVWSEDSQNPVAPVSGSTFAGRRGYVLNLYGTPNYRKLS